MTLLWLRLKLLFIQRLHLRVKYVRIPEAKWRELRAKVLEIGLGSDTVGFDSYGPA